MSAKIPIPKGSKFARLTVIGDSISIAKKNGTALKYPCVCDCGNERLVLAGQLRNGKSKSCGCLQREVTIKRNKKHGLSGTREYMIWKGIRRRCNQTGCQDYEDYGGRGIKICERWNDFENFLQDMGKRPTPTHSVDRIDGDGNYSPDNCRWATPVEQANNKRPR